MTVRRYAFLISVALLVIASAIAFPIASGGDVVVTEINLEQLPRHILDFEGRPDRFDESVYRVLNADYNVLREYRSADGRNVWVYVGYYGTAKGGRPSHVPQSCYAGQGFSIVEWTTIPALSPVEGALPSPADLSRAKSREGPAPALSSVDLSRAGPRERAAPNEVNRNINKMHVKRGNVHQLVLFWQQSKDTVLADGIEQNLHRLKNRLFYNRDDGAFVRLSTNMDAGQETEALALLQDFASELLRLLPAYWPVEGPAATARSR